MLVSFFGYLIFKKIKRPGSSKFGHVEMETGVAKQKNGYAGLENESISITERKEESEI